MSTKTTFKRIALVTVAALATGVLTSVSPASAAPAVGDLASSTAASATNYGVLSATTSGTTSTYEMLVNGQAAFSGTGAADLATAGDNVKYAVTSGSGSITYITDATGGTDNIAGVLATDGQTATWTAAATGDDAGFGFVFKPTAVGTTTILYTKKVGTTVSTVETIKIIAVASAAASASGVLSVSNSFFSREATGTAATDNVDNSTSAIANGGIGYVGLDLRDAFGGDLATGSIVVSATGGAKVAYGADATSSSLSNAYASDAGTSDYFSVVQGTANTAVSTTVTLTYNGEIVGVKAFTFTGDIAKIKVSANAADGLAINPVATTATGYKVYAYDAADNQIAYAVAVDSSKYTPVFTAQTLAAATTSTSTFIAGGWTCAKAGTATMRVKATNLLGATIYSNDFTAQCGGSVDKYTATLDKTSYLPGDIATLTIKAVDSSNFPVNDTVQVGANVAIAGSYLTAVSAPLAADTFTWGTKTYKFIVGPTSGSYALAVDLPAYASADSAKTVAYKIAGGSATLESVLAAIVKLIAAINKQIAQLAKKK